jgi:death on curing protein
VSVWLSRQVVVSLHDLMIARYGGSDGIRDESLLESALARPLNLAGYGDPDTAELAALYAIAITRNHPFIDGNKRTAFSALTLFLALNGLELEAPEVEAVVIMLRLAANDISDEEFTAWVHSHAAGSHS